MKHVKTRTHVVRTTFKTFHYSNEEQQLNHEKEMQFYGYERYDADCDNKEAWATYFKQDTIEEVIDNSIINL
ncbi:hypothetical protein ABHN03_16820 [Paenibacillus sp. NRS-1775]|uniref:hypothetical protein n=1 Tax=unclassified Paenibacillus TaxID=185978 RepID=UPI003D26856D